MDPVTIFLVVLIGLLVLLVVFLAARRRGGPARGLRDEIALVVDDRLIAFQNAVQGSVQAARQDVQSTNAAMQRSALEIQKVMNGLGRTIHELVTQQQGATRLAEDLKSLLQSPKLRGSYGEEILEEMLARVLPSGIWRRQERIAGREIVDAVVDFKGVLYPIDAKFPRDDYERYLEAETEDEKRRAWRAYEKAIERQVEGIAAKYVRPEAGTADFALMFIPSEAVYYETIAHENALGDPNRLLRYAEERKVVPVSPSTFYAFLQVILAAARNADLVAGAKRLQEGLKQVQYSFDRFYDRYAEIGSSLEKASEAYRKGDDHVRRFRDRVERVIALEVEPSAPVEGSPDPRVVTAPRTVK